MTVSVTTTDIFGVQLLTIPRYTDERGYFVVSFQNELLRQVGIDCEFVQDNESVSTKNVIRGLHYQIAPYAQDKLVRVVQGVVRDVIVDLRVKSPTFGQWTAIDLSGAESQLLFVPAGCAHGFAVHSSQAIFQYKVSSPYVVTAERGIRFDDPTLQIEWGVDSPILSAKDAQLPTFAEVFHS